MSKIIEPSQYNLSTAIIVKKQEMIKLGNKYGLTDIRTVKCSQQLDKLLNRYESKKELCIS
ncbi:Spo0E family sporulation regulatory protein-aspartic acid phosphatase [Halobacillus seohaensis]|uniref:Spo0E family sporulation regulatory protein-aspartic acid phosphatase n=1 Tax=Halobacillus seohaensis TaxID=447421 RepID=A0ABW2EHB9_9BACI